MTGEEQDEALADGAGAAQDAYSGMSRTRQQEWGTLRSPSLTASFLGKFRRHDILYLKI